MLSPLQACKACPVAVHPLLAQRELGKLMSALRQHSRLGIQQRDTLQHSVVLGSQDGLSRLLPVVVQGKLPNPKQLLVLAQHVTRGCLHPIAVVELVKRQVVEQLLLE